MNIDRMVMKEAMGDRRSKHMSKFFQSINLATAPVIAFLSVLGRKNLALRIPEDLGYGQF